MTRIQKINLVLLVVTWLGLVGNVVGSQRVIRMQRDIINTQMIAMKAWQARALACENGSIVRSSEGSCCY